MFTWLCRSPSKRQNPIPLTARGSQAEGGVSAFWSLFRQKVTLPHVASNLPTMFVTQLLPDFHSQIHAFGPHLFSEVIVLF